MYIFAFITDVKATYNAITSFNHYAIEITGVDVNIQ